MEGMIILWAVRFVFSGQKQPRYCNFSLGRSEAFMLLVRSFRRLLQRFIAPTLFLFFSALAGTVAAVDQTDISCVGCHTTPGLNTRLPDGGTLQLAIDVERLKDSVHSTLHCTSCHAEIQKYPHPKITASDRRDYQMQNSRQCQSCHERQYQLEQDGNHARALAAGNRNAAVCIDCHGSHEVARSGKPRHKISTNCGKCHGGIYQQYLSSAHGRSLLADSNPDVPVCTDCHGGHNQEDPRSQSFRLKSPKLCAKCHADSKLMRKYGISPDVFNTYVADFHGLTITLFEKQHPEQRVNTAVCTDCHGVHDIQQTTDANSAVIKENLANTCRKCHPDANATFPDSWVGHFPPTRDRYPLVYFVTLFYKFLIPITIGGMALFVVVDYGGRVLRRIRNKRA
jgi:hypothetical protein